MNSSEDKFTIVRLELTDAHLADALGREAIARTHIIGRQFFIAIRSGLSAQEFSVTITKFWRRRRSP